MHGNLLLALNSVTSKSFIQSSLENGYPSIWRSLHLNFLVRHLKQEYLVIILYFHKLFTDKFSCKMQTYMEFDYIWIRLNCLFQELQQSNSEMTMLTEENHSKEESLRKVSCELEGAREEVCTLKHVQEVRVTTIFPF